MTFPSPSALGLSPDVAGATFMAAGKAVASEMKLNCGNTKHNEKATVQCSAGMYDVKNLLVWEFPA